MGMECHDVIPAEPVNVILRQPVVSPLRPKPANAYAELCRLARRMRTEWREQRYSRLLGN